MLGTGLFFSPVQPLAKRAKRPPWAFSKEVDEEPSRDPNGRATANNNTNTPSSRSPRSRPPHLDPHLDSEVVPDLAPASFSPSPSPSGSALDSNAPEHMPRLLRRRRRASSTYFGIARNVSARPFVKPIVEQRTPLPTPSDDGDYDDGYAGGYGGLDHRRRTSKRCTGSTQICRICASLAVLALIGIVLVARLVLLSKLSKLSNSDASATKVEPADTSSLAHHTRRSFPVAPNDDADRPEAATVQAQADGSSFADTHRSFAIPLNGEDTDRFESDTATVPADGSSFVGTHRTFPLSQNDADWGSEAVTVNVQDGLRGSTGEEQEAPDSARAYGQQGSHHNMVDENREQQSVIDEARRTAGEAQLPPIAGVEKQRVHRSNPGGTRPTAADLLEQPMLVPQLHAGFESIQPIASKESSSPAREQCWVYMYMEGGGGATVRSIATDHWLRDEVMFDSVQWRRGDGYASDVMTRSHWRLLHGGCVESLRRYTDVEKRCKWFTVFRHPVARLLSTFDHCRDAPQDPLCASAGTATGDIVAFAEHWGNFGLRQFAMSTVSSNAVKKWAETNNPGRGVSVWRLLKGYLEQGGVARDRVVEGGVEPGGDAKSGGVARGGVAQGWATEGGVEQGGALEGLLEPVKELLRTQYAAVGIANELNTTMLLFDKALSMSSLNWSSALKRRTNLGVRDIERDDPAGKMAMAEREALANPRIAAALRLDILLYDHAVRVFHEQARMYGVA